MVYKCFINLCHFAFNDIMEVMSIENDFSKKCKELKEVIIESYDWTGESDFDKRLEENLRDKPELRKFYNENFKNI